MTHARIGWRCVSVAQCPGDPDVRYTVFYSLHSGEWVETSQQAKMTLVEVHANLLVKMVHSEDFFGLVDDTGTTFQVAYDPQTQRYWCELVAPAKRGSYGRLLSFLDIASLIRELPPRFHAADFPSFDFQTWVTEHAKRDETSDSLSLDMGQVGETLHLLAFLTGVTGGVLALAGLAVDLVYVAGAGGVLFMLGMALAGSVYRRSRVVVRAHHVSIRGRFGTSWPLLRTRKLPIALLAMDWHRAAIPGDERALFSVHFSTPEETLSLHSVACTVTDLEELQGAIQHRQAAAQAAFGQGQAEVPNALLALREDLK